MCCLSCFSNFAFLHNLVGTEDVTEQARKAAVKQGRTTDQNLSEAWSMLGLGRRRQARQNRRVRQRVAAGGSTKAPVPSVDKSGGTDSSSSSDVSDHASDVSVVEGEASMSTFMKSAWADVVEAEEGEAGDKEDEDDIYYNDKTHEFHPECGKILGRVSVIKKDNSCDQISVYCRLHQCSCLFRSSKVSLPNHKFKQWFREGLALGRGSEYRCLHKARLRELASPS